MKKELLKTTNGFMFFDHDGSFFSIEKEGNNLIVNYNEKTKKYKLDYERGMVFHVLKTKVKSSMGIDDFIGNMYKSALETLAGDSGYEVRWFRNACFEIQ